VRRLSGKNRKKAGAAIAVLMKNIHRPKIGGYFDDFNRLHYSFQPKGSLLSAACVCTQKAQRILGNREHSTAKMLRR
jgi:hypothetical protein